MSEKVNKIEYIKYFSCGFCINNMKTIFKGVKKEKIIFPAGVFLIKHKQKGYILYDTGYNIEITNKNIKYILYNMTNPVIIKKENMIVEQLKKININPNDINYIILSHLHPDHIGGLKDIENAKIIITKDCFLEYKKNELKSLIFREFLPENFEKRLEIIDVNKLGEVKDIFSYMKSYDLFDDNSILISSVNGHTKGQGCIFINEKNIFIASDLCWKTEFIDLTEKMKLMPRLIQNNFYEYQKGIEILKKILYKSDIKVLVSHDSVEKIKSIKEIEIL